MKETGNKERVWGVGLGLGLDSRLVGGLGCC